MRKIAVNGKKNTIRSMASIPALSKIRFVMDIGKDPDIFLDKSVQILNTPHKCSDSIVVQIKKKLKQATNEGILTCLGEKEPRS